MKTIEIRQRLRPSKKAYLIGKDYPLAYYYGSHDYY